MILLLMMITDSLNWAPYRTSEISNLKLSWDYLELITNLVVLLLLGMWQVELLLLKKPVVLFLIRKFPLTHKLPLSWWGFANKLTFSSFFVFSFLHHQVWRRFWRHVEESSSNQLLSQGSLCCCSEGSWVKPSVMTLDQIFICFTTIVISVFI